jgi:hypothetical protein
VSCAITPFLMAHQWRKKICAITIGAPSKKGMAQWRTITLFSTAHQWRNGALNGVAKNLVCARCPLFVLTRAAHGSSAVLCRLLKSAARAAGIVATLLPARCRVCCAAMSAITPLTSAAAVRQSVLTMSSTTPTHGVVMSSHRTRVPWSTPTTNNRSRGAVRTVRSASLRSRCAHGNANSRREWLRRPNTHHWLYLLDVLHAMRVLLLRNSLQVSRDPSLCRRFKYLV